jgi:hypothetical protein
MEITTLIPGYKVKNIANLIIGIANQTHKPKKIIISDDSNNFQFTSEFLNSQQYPLLKDISIEFFKGPQNGAYENFKQLIKIWNHESELVHLMLDDDFIYPLFYEKHFLTHSSGNFSCSVSPRWSANHDGIPIRHQDVPDVIKFNSNKIISMSKDIVFSTTAAECKNWLGEFSNTVMHKSTCDLILKPELVQISYAGLWDLGYFINASQHNPIAYVNEYLSFFRLGGESNSSKIFGPHMKAAFLAYAALTRASQKLNQITIEKEKENYLKLYHFIKTYYTNEIDLQELTDIIFSMSTDPDKYENEYIQSWNSFLSLHKL